MGAYRNYGMKKMGGGMSGAAARTGEFKERED